LESFPFTKMFFRPEEVHRTSGVWYFEHPLPNGHGDMSDQSLRFLNLDLTVLHLDTYRISTIETHRINSYRLSRKEPADRQRFKCSLAEPLLFAIDGQAVVCRQIVKWGK
jgi:hypothetical protein